jgi:hypothetical protein
MRNEQREKAQKYLNHDRWNIVDPLHAIKVKRHVRCREVDLEISDRSDASGIQIEGEKYPMASWSATFRSVN